MQENMFLVRDYALFICFFKNEVFVKVVLISLYASLIDKIIQCFVSKLISPLIFSCRNRVSEVPYIGFLRTCSSCINPLLKCSQIETRVALSWNHQWKSARDKTLFTNGVKLTYIFNPHVQSLESLVRRPASPRFHEWKQRRLRWQRDWNNIYTHRPRVPLTNVDEFHRKDKYMNRPRKVGHVIQVESVLFIMKEYVP